MYLVLIKDKRHLIASGLESAPAQLLADCVDLLSPTGVRSPYGEDGYMIPQGFLTSI